ncbi:MAG: NifU family protein [Bdellovibrionota bacterium]
MKVEIIDIGQPEFRKFTFDQTISKTEVEYPSSTQAERSPLANKIFGFPWTEQVTVGTDHVVVKKQDWVDWEMLAEPLAGLIKEHFDMLKSDGVQDFEENPPLKTVDPTKTAEELSSSLAQNPFAAQVQKVLDSDINPMVASHGGKVSLVDLTQDTVYVKLEGGCQGCSSSQATLKQGVEIAIKRALPSIQNVIDVTDHASGHNPYM